MKVWALLKHVLTSLLAVHFHRVVANLVLSKAREPRPGVISVCDMRLRGKSLWRKQHRCYRSDFSQDYLLVIGTHNNSYMGTRDVHIVPSYSCFGRSRHTGSITFHTITMSGRVLAGREVIFNTLRGDANLLLVLTRHHFCMPTRSSVNMNVTAVVFNAIRVASILYNYL